jgi:hypothetical protein
MAAGFHGSLRVVAEWATRRRRAEGAGCERLRKPPSARLLSRLLLSERDHLTKGDAITVARIERGVPTLVSARDLVERFHRMVRDREPAALPTGSPMPRAASSHPSAKALSPITELSPQR